MSAQGGEGGDIFSQPVKSFSCLKVELHDGEISAGDCAGIKNVLSEHRISKANNQPKTPHNKRTEEVFSLWSP